MSATPTSYTVIGAGAVGLLYGTRLAVAGHPVRWLVRSGADRIRSDGLRVESGGAVLRVAPRDVAVYTDPSAVPASDVVVVATKTTANSELGSMVRSVCAPGATVAVFQNGLGAEERVRNEVRTAGPVLGALCFVCVERTAHGCAVHLDYGAVTLAPLDDVADAGGRSGVDAAARVAGDLRGAGVDASVLADLGTARWRKLVWNVPFNGLCTVLGATTAELLGDPVTRELVAQLMDEVIAAAGAVGHRIEAAFRDEMLATTDAMRAYAPSMKLDHDAGRPLEVDAIHGAALAAATAAGATVPRIAMLTAMLRHLDVGRAGRD